MVANKTITYTEEEKALASNTTTGTKDIIVRSLKQPTCISAKSEGNTIKLDIEKELGIEIVGDTKVKIASVDDEDDIWDELESVNDIDKINPNYIDEEIIK